MRVIVFDLTDGTPAKPAEEPQEVLSDECVGELGYWMSAEGVDQNIDVVFKSFNLKPVNCFSQVFLPHTAALSCSWLFSVFSLFSLFVCLEIIKKKKNPRYHLHPSFEKEPAWLETKEEGLFSLTLCADC